VNAWPNLSLAEWGDTYATLHRWSQVVGKIRLAQAPPVNHWWHVTLYVTSRGLTTSPMPHGDRSFQIDFDFVDHRLAITASDGQKRSLPLAPMSVADFYQRVMDALEELGLPVRIWPMPVEIPDPITRFTDDREHASYDPDSVNRFWRILLQSDRVMTGFRGRFLGKASPSHFFWGGFDLAATRFSGRPAPPHPGGIPNVGDFVNREAYSHEVSSAGYWPGGGGVDDGAFYAYAYPEPAGFREARVGPAEAYYDDTMRLFLLPYEVVRRATDPDRAVLSFLQTTYEAAADHAGWDRAALER
jgi:hypothetical protein